MVGPVVSLLLRGEVLLFLLLAIALIVSLTFHEYAHAAVAKLSGDRTAELAGRLTLNPLAHVDPMGLLMVVLVGFGYTYNYSQLLHSVLNALYTQYVCDGSFLYVLVFALRLTSSQSYKHSPSTKAKHHSCLR